MNSKSKMVSFRLSAEEYARLRDAAQAAGVHSLSELARTAMQRILEGHNGHSLTVAEQVNNLRAKVDSISLEVDRLAQLVTKTNGAGA